MSISFGSAWAPGPHRRARVRRLLRPRPAFVLLFTLALACLGFAGLRELRWQVLMLQHTPADTWQMLNACARRVVAHARTTGALPLDRVSVVPSRLDRWLSLNGWSSADCIDPSRRPLRYTRNSPTRFTLAPRPDAQQELLRDFGCKVSVTYELDPKVSTAEPELVASEPLPPSELERRFDYIAFGCRDQL